MYTILSLVTSVKDYIEIAHKLVETQAYSLQSNPFPSGETGTLLDGIKNYTEYGSVLTFVILSIKEFLTSFLSLSWLKNIWSYPLIVPDIASAMISEISVYDSYFTNAFSFLENGLNSANNNNNNLVTVTQNPYLYGFEKFMIGFLNSIFLVLPSSTSHLITIRRFVMQGLEAGYMAGLGTIAGNILWISSIILGWRFIVIPWLSLDIFRYILGFILLLKYLWDSSKELNKTSTTGTLENNAKTKIFLLNFLLALTEQTSIYPFISNISFGAEGSILEGFYGSGLQTDNLLQFYAIHGCYLIGILVGCFSLLQFTVWFWENPAFSIYMWMVSSYKVTTSSYYKVLNFVFLYLTMFCAISSIPYFGLDYTITNPLGLIPQDRILQQKSLGSSSGPGDKLLQETSFLGVNPTDKNSRIRDGVHARRERWKERLIKYQAFDASLYDQGSYDILTIEDLNYGFDRFWLRRKMRNHQIRFRLFPGPWMRSLKKQLNKPGFTGPRVEFFRILFEQYYHPCFHASNTNTKKAFGSNNNFGNLSSSNNALAFSNSIDSAIPKGRNQNNNTKSLYSVQPHVNNVVKNKFKTVKDYVHTHQYSALRKFSRYYSNRLNTKSLTNPNYSSIVLINNSGNKQQNNIYSKSLKSLFTKIYSEYSKEKLNIFRNISKNILMPNPSVDKKAKDSFFNSKTPVWGQTDYSTNSIKSSFSSFKNTNIRKKLSKKERLLLMYKTNISGESITGLNPNTTTKSVNKSLNQKDSFWELASAKQRLEGSNSKEFNLSLELNQNQSFYNQTSVLQPLNFYFQKDEAFKRKLKYYSTAVTRNYTVGNNAPYLKTMLKRAFFYYKPSLRLKRTLFTAAMRRGFRKKSVNPKRLVYPVNAITTTNTSNSLEKDLDYNNTTMANSTTGPVISRSTTSYSVLGKRASRYRYQIYKDVLQHWYYTPFNRLLLKFDIDSFINRQPKTHFNTLKEERLLHYRRLLLSEHYNTLRWYTYMQHYRTMKTRIGGTKSFANTVYNQQFQGSFKKIRHLFSVTPSQGDMSVLKFDQVLFNEGFKPLSGNTLQLKPLNSPNTVNQGSDIKSSQDLPKDFIDQSLALTGEIYKSQKQNQNFKIEQYIKGKNYAGVVNTLAYNQSGTYNFGDFNSKEGFNSLELNQLNPEITNNQTEGFKTKEILFQLLKECKRRLNDQTFLKNYASHRISKREQRNIETEKELKIGLEYLKVWLSPISINNKYSDALNGSLLQNNTNNSTLTTGLRKALNEGVYALNNINPAISSKTLSLSQTNTLKFKNLQSLKNATLNGAQTNASLGKQYTSTLSLQTLNSIQSLTQKVKGMENKYNKTLKNNLRTSYTGLNQTSTTKTIGLIKTTINKVLKPFYYIQNVLLAKRSEKNLEWWRQKQRAMGRIQASRKKGRFKTIQTTVAEQQKQRSVDSYINQSFQSSSTPYQNFKDSKDSYSSAFQSSDQYIKKVDYTDQQSYNKNDTKIKQSESGSSWGLKQKVLQKLGFLKKFRKKPSSKGRRFRVFTSSSSARGFAYIKKPKKANGDLSIVDLAPNQIVNTFAKLAKFAEGKEEAEQKQGLNSKEYNQGLQNQKLLLLGRNNYNLTLLKDVKEALVSKTTKLLLSSSGLSVPFSHSETRREGKVFSQSLDSTNTILRNLVPRSGIKESLKTLKDLLKQTNIKKSPTKKNTLAKRTFKRRKRHKFSRNLQKYRKRQLQGLGKYRKYSKKLQRIQATLELRNWWWNNYLPTIVEKNLLNNSSLASNKKDYKSFSYKPLSTTKALEISKDLRSSTKPLVSSTCSNNLENKLISVDWGMCQPSTQEQSLQTKNGGSLTQPSQNNNISSDFNKMDKPTLVDQIILDLLVRSTNNTNSLNANNSNVLKNTYTTTNIPFYAGWDESLRKFVVTNRLLSRRDTGFEVSFNNIFSSTNTLNGYTNTPVNKVQFSKTPIQGLNEGSFLYLQNASDSGQILPFNAYTIDQFIPNNQSFYAPLGWKRFQFRHSLLKNWYTDISVAKNSQALKKSIFLKPYSVSSLEFFNNKNTNNKSLEQIRNYKNTKALQNRRIKKRYKLVKQTPIQLMYVPTGSLLTEVLPSHYISVFDKQYRFPRNRYLKRHLLKSSAQKGLMLKEQNSISYNPEQNQLYTKDLTVLEYSTFKQTNQSLQNPEFSLRKRIKPRRKYHKKRFSKKDSLIFPRRYKFGMALSNYSRNGINTFHYSLNSLDNNMDGNPNFRLRPSSTTKQTGINKNKSKKRSPKANPVRLRQLRRREFQQVYKPLQRFQPRYGGFVWPGDYLRLDIIPMPKLQSLKSLYTNSSPSSNNSGLEQSVSNPALSNKIKSPSSPLANKVKKINVQPVGLLPRKYLIQKHNIKVLKKKYALGLKL